MAKKGKIGDRNVRTLRQRLRLFHKLFFEPCSWCKGKKGWRVVTDDGFRWTDQRRSYVDDHGKTHDYWVQHLIKHDHLVETHWQPCPYCHGTGEQRRMPKGHIMKITRKNKRQ